MKRPSLTIGLVTTLAMMVASCGKSPAPAESATAADTAAAAPAAAAGDPCTLIDDPSKVFGKPVTAGVVTMPNKTQSCEWKDGAGGMCGLVTVFGPGWNEVPDLEANYSAMVSSLSVFGKTQPLEGVGDEAVLVDGGILGAQAALRTGDAIANIAAACAGSGPANLAHLDKLVRAVAGKL